MFEFNDKANDFAVVRGIIQEIEQKINQKYPSYLRFQKVSFFVCSELIRNASRHSIQKNNILLAVNTSENKLFYLCENVIHNDEIPKLQNEIEALNNLEPKQFKNYYKNKMRTGRLGMGGATLGLIDLRRKTKNKLLIVRYRNVFFNKKFFYYSEESSF